jgi:hypothetical protein
LDLRNPNDFVIHIVIFVTAEGVLVGVNDATSACIDADLVEAMGDIGQSLPDTTQPASHRYSCCCWTCSWQQVCWGCTLLLLLLL